MEQRINVAKLLKDCPTGMELDCTMYDSVTLLSVDDREDICFPIRVVREDGNYIALTKYGQYTDANFAKCVIFPKDKTTWEGFRRPFKDGDIIYVESKSYSPGLISIYKKEDSLLFYDYCAVSLDGKSFYLDNIYGLIQKDKIVISRLATSEEEQILFDAIKKNGYKWNPETKTLEKLIVPKFKVGDKIRHKTTNKGDVYEISKVYDDSYGLVDFMWMIYMKYQDQYELVPNKFDITTLKPFDKVLVRNDNSCVWKCNFYSHYSQYPHHYICADTSYRQCIPFKGNEHLRGTINDCDEYYKTWE